MNKSGEFDFGDDSVAKSYDAILVPSLFEPWATNLINDHQPWAGNSVLDLACGTGVVTKELARSVIPGGNVIALDINQQMLDLAKLKCEEWTGHIEFIVGSADAMDVTDQAVDKVVCQQGFQFFPNKKDSAIEIHRVLKPGGVAIVSTWCPVTECEIFGAVCEALEQMGLDEISQLMRIPFDLLTQNELLDSFSGIGFSDVQISKQQQDLMLIGGLEKAPAFAYATPIGPKLMALEKSTQEEFKRVLIEKVQAILLPDGSFGRMVSNVLTAAKAG